LMLVLIALPFFLLPYVKDVIGIILIVGIASVGRAGGLNVARSFLSKRVDQNLSATGMAVTDTFHYLGRVIGPLYAGLIVDLFAFSLLFSSVALLAFVGIAIFIIIWMFKK